MAENKLINVTNKSIGLVIFKTSFGRREFYTGQTRKIPLEELQELSQTPGGSELLYNYLFIEDPKVMQEDLEIKTEPEYYLKEADIPAWMDTCTLDQFKDALDFAPEGTKDIIKQLAVSKPLNDYAKRQAIKEQLGFDVSHALELLAPDKEEEEEKKKAEANKPAGRRTAPLETGRRSSSITIPGQNKE